MPNNKRKCLTGVSPPPLRLPKNAINPEQVLHNHHYHRRGGLGDRHRPNLHHSGVL